MNKFIKEPLVHFLVLGLVIFLVYGLMNQGEEGANETIIIDDNDVERLIQNYQKSWSEYPDQKNQI